MPTSSDRGTAAPDLGAPAPRRFELFGGPGSRLHPRPSDPQDFPGWRSRILAAVRRCGAVPAGASPPIDAALLSGSTAGALLREDYQFSLGSEKFRATLVRPAGRDRLPAVVVCPGRNAIVGQVTGAEPPDYPDRDIAARFARAGFVTLTLDYGLSGRVDPERLYGRDEAAVLAHLYAAAGQSLLAALALNAATAASWLNGQSGVQPGHVALFGHSLGGAVALHAALCAEHPPPLCVASHLGSYQILGYGHPALVLPGIARDADLPDLYAALAPAPLQLQYGLADHELDPADAAAAGQQVRELYRVAGAAGRAEVLALPMGHGTAPGPAIDFLNRTLNGPAAQPLIPPGPLIPHAEQDVVAALRKELS